MGVVFNPFTGNFDFTGSGGGGGAVDSVNGQTGVVVLDAADVDALPLLGGTMLGPINMGGQSLSNLPSPSSSTEPTTKDYVDTALGTKQDMLVSGTNIKTVNGADLLGSGDLTVSAAITQTVIDFGSTSKTDEVFIITDAAISPTSKVIASMAWNSSLSRDPDEIMADPISISVEPLSGSMNIYAMALEGEVQGQYAINYQVA